MALNILALHSKQLHLATGCSLHEKHLLLLFHAQQYSSTSACCQYFYHSCKCCSLIHLSKEHLAWQTRIWFDSFNIVSCIIHVLLPKLSPFFLVPLRDPEKRRIWARPEWKDVLLTCSSLVNTPLQHKIKREWEMELASSRGRQADCTNACCRRVPLCT